MTRAHLLFERKQKDRATTTATMKDGRTYTITLEPGENGVDRVVYAKVGDTYMGDAHFWQNNLSPDDLSVRHPSHIGSWSASSLVVNREFQRQGVATALYDFMYQCGYRIVRSGLYGGSLKPDGVSLWQTRQKPFRIGKPPLKPDPYWKPKKQPVREEAEADSKAKRQEYVRLFNRIPTLYKDADGRECWKATPLERWFPQVPDSELDELITSATETLDYLAKNKKARLPDPYKAMLPNRKQMATLKVIMPRVKAPFSKWVHATYPGDGEADAMLTGNAAFDCLRDFLKDEYSIEVRRDGLIHFWMLEPGTASVIGDLPIVLFHFTASGVAARIREQGLTAGNVTINGTKTDGVYLTTEQSGPPVEGYLRNAVRAHRGYGVMITVCTTLSEVTPDEDDRDIQSGRHQFVTDHIDPSQIISIVKSS